MNRLWMRGVLAALVVVAAGVVPSAPASGSTGSRWVMGYYVGYLHDSMPVGEIEWAAMTHIVVGPVTPRSDGTLDTSLDIDATAGPALGKKLAAAATAHGVTPMLMIGGAGAHDAFLAAARDHRTTFEKNLLTLMKKWGYAGLDLDWEPLATSDQPVVKRLVTDLRAKAPSAVLTMPVGWIDPNYQTVPAFYAKLAQSLDRIDVMTYGMAGAWDGWKSWHSSALYTDSADTPSSVASSIAAYEAAGVPAAKLGAGVGFYGSCWTAPVTGPGQDIGGSHIAADDNVMTYVTIMKKYYSAANYVYDSAAEAPYLSFSSPVGPYHCTFLSYEDTRSVTAKGTWAASNGLGALIVWNINEGHDRSAPAGSRDALLATVRSSFGA